MLCAHTVRRLTPGSFDAFTERFSPPEDSMAESGWVRFHVLRNLQNPDEVVTFGFFDGTLEQLEGSQDDHGYEDMRSSIDDLVAEVVVNGVYEVVVSKTPAPTA